MLTLAMQNDACPTSSDCLSRWLSSPWQRTMHPLCCFICRGFKYYSCQWSVLRIDFYSALSDKSSIEYLSILMFKLVHQVQK